MIHLGTAGWAISPDNKPLFPPEGSHLARYSASFNAVEINSSFYRDHRAATYERWARTVPADFRFSVKLAKRITHGAKLECARAELAEAVLPPLSLREKLGVILIQLPPSLAFHEGVVHDFLENLRSITAAPLALEPRHPSWVHREAARLFRQFRVTKVTADPAPCPDSHQWFAGAGDFSYVRLHGSPKIYYSAYEAGFLKSLAEGLRGAEAWVIFDNTALGHAPNDALRLGSFLELRKEAA